MNLQSIQKRVEELSAELITISNDLSFLIQGDVQRNPVEVERLRHFSEVKEGDKLRFDAIFNDICGQRHDAGEYEVYEVEDAGYEGSYDVALRRGGGLMWLDFSDVSSSVRVTKVSA